MAYVMILKQLYSFSAPKTSMLLCVWHYCRRRWESSNQRAPQGGDCPMAFKPRLSAAAAPLPLPPPPPCNDRPAVQAAPAIPATVNAPPTNQTLAAVKAYRHALGLCYKCNSKWSKDHVCAPKILHVVEALWDSISSDDSLADSTKDFPTTKQCCLARSKSIISRVLASRTIYF